jgi:hypothetical protein
MSKIKIGNPRAGGAKYASFNSAEKYILKGQATISSQGELCFFRNEETQKEHLDHARRTAEHFRLNPHLLRERSDLGNGSYRDILLATFREEVKHLTKRQSI